MFKTTVRICFALLFALVATRANARQASQPVFTVVNGFDVSQGSSRANATVALPVLGFVLDQAGGLRPLIGIAGSASVGSPLNLGMAIVQAAIPPAHDYILAITADSNWPVLLHVSGNTISVGSGNVFFTNRNALISGCRGAAFADDGGRCRGRVDLSPRIDRIALSPTGSAAALFSEAGGRIYTFSNLSHSPTSLGSFDVSALGTISAFGISDDGHTLALGVSDGRGGSLYLAESGQSPRLIASMAHPSAVQFLRNSAGAVIADDIDNAIYALQGGQVYPIAGPADGIATPVGVAASNDNQKVFVGNSATGSVTTIGLNGTGMQSTSCNCTLAEFQPTNVDSVFELTGFSGGSISLFDGNSTTPRMILVPVGAQF
jgi:hypothetical protein